MFVDVLRCTTCVAVACAWGALVLPYEWQDASVARDAARHQALVAGQRGHPASPWSLSPTDLLAIARGTRLVLPSPNGSVLSFDRQRVSPEGLATTAALRDAQSAIESTLMRSGSGRELIARGWADDVATAAQLDADDCGALLRLPVREYACAQ